jgi:hypothetical protein
MLIPAKPLPGPTVGHAMLQSRRITCAPCSNHPKRTHIFAKLVCNSMIQLLTGRWKRVCPRKHPGDGPQPLHQFGLLAASTGNYCILPNLLLAPRSDMHCCKAGICPKCAGIFESMSASHRQVEARLRPRKHPGVTQCVQAATPQRITRDAGKHWCQTECMAVP